ncbi:TPA: hypothetical protein HA318_02385 [Candidatus Micrarchaeota archaeon]|nr:hypothetical protein [Candidatus Micrarchaeota archaeon]
MRVLLDTNFLLDVFRKRASLAPLEEVFDERVELVVLSPCVEELKDIAVSGGERDRHAAKAALELVAKAACVEVVEGKADEAVLAWAGAHSGAGVCTGDRVLRAGLKGKRVKVVFWKAGRPVR